MQGNYYYFLADLALLAEEEHSIGIWEQRCRQYLKEHHRILYYNLPTACKPNSYLAADEDIMAISKGLIEKNRAAYEVLVK